MLIRIFEYITQEALDSGTVSNYQLIVTIPNAAVLFLRSNSNTPNSMNIVINTPGGSVSFDVHIIKVNAYSLQQLFDKNLFFLLPFYIFNLEDDFPKYNRDKKALETLKNIYVDFMLRLEKAMDDGLISAYYRRTILDMSKKVLENIAAKYKNIKKGVNDIMGGQVLEHEGKTIYNAGIKEGEERGMRRANIETARRLRQAGISDAQIQQFTNLSLEDLTLL